MNLKKNLKRGMLTLCVTFGVIQIQAQNVGVGEPAPSSKLDIVNTGATGNALEVNHTVNTSTSSAAFIVNNGSSAAINAASVNIGNAAPAVNVSQLGTGISSRGIDVNMDAASTALGIAVFQDGSSDAILTSVAGAQYGLANYFAGLGGGVYNDLSTGGGSGAYNRFGGEDGEGMFVDSLGDGFGYIAFVQTQTPSSGGSTFGGVVGAVQSGVGHGILINHVGPDGRNAEFNINNTNNNDDLLFLTNQGGGSTISAQNQDNTILGTMVVGDFSYVGTDVADHVAVRGESDPAAGWGIGVEGIGGWYGVACNGAFTATGAKAFTIDHPADPANQMIHHYSLESDEVLNMYRGIIQLDASGEATVQLPDYFSLININFSYQLTPIGTPQQPYVLQEIQGNNTFKVAGAANTKVSWMVIAERNDPYMQQNPRQRLVIEQKTGDRAGKYWTPEVWGAPASARITAPPAETHETTRIQRTPPRVQPSAKALPVSLQEEK